MFRKNHLVDRHLVDRINALETAIVTGAIKTTDYLKQLLFLIDIDDVNILKTLEYEAKLKAFSVPLDFIKACHRFISTPSEQSEHSYREIYKTYIGNDDPIIYASSRKSQLNVLYNQYNESEAKIVLENAAIEAAKLIVDTSDLFNDRENFLYLKNKIQLNNGESLSENDIRKGKKNVVETGSLLKSSEQKEKAPILVVDANRLKQQHTASSPISPPMVKGVSPAPDPLLPPPLPNKPIKKVLPSIDPLIENIIDCFAHWNKNDKHEGIKSLGKVCTDKKVSNQDKWAQIVKICKKHTSLLGSFSNYNILQKGGKRDQKIDLLYRSIAEFEANIGKRSANHRFHSTLIFR